MTRAMFKKRRSGRSAARQPWPCSVADIGLDGRTPHEVVTILLRWAGAAPVGHSILSLLGGLGHFWEPYAREILQNHHVVYTVRMQLDSSIKEYIHPAPPRASCDFFHRVISSCRILMADLTKVEVENTSRYPHWEEELYDMGAPLIPLLIQRGESMRAELDWFCRMLRSRRIPLSQFPGAPEMKRKDPRLFNDDHFHARLQMLYLNRTHRCMHLHCTTNSATRAVVTTFCRRCMVVKFCNTKDLCDKIHLIRTNVGMLDDEKWATWLVHSAMLDTSACFTEHAVRKTTCRAIWLYIMRLRREKQLIHPTRINVKAMRALKLGNMSQRFIIEGRERRGEV
ncbi:hypothetical protein C8R43DRAFT_1238488 [Mycena crocata]|nr:hypothetical protein C8R43DRAFT_1238488 [Mycena crocata]